MPVYEFQCRNGHRSEDLLPPGTQEIECPVCFQPAQKLVSKCLLRMHERMDDSAMMLNGLQEQWVNSPEVRAKLDSGEYQIDRRADDEFDAPSSSISQAFEKAEADRMRDDCLEGRYSSQEEFFAKAEKAMKFEKVGIENE